MTTEAEYWSNYLEIIFYSKMIPVICDEISELETTIEIVVKKEVLRLSDLVRASQDWNLCSHFQLKNVYLVEPSFSKMPVLISGEGKWSTG